MALFWVGVNITLDHVTPHRLGGRTDEANLVTSCWPCNYGKMEYTVEQIGIVDPLLTPPMEDGERASFVLERSRLPGCLMPGLVKSYKEMELERISL
ncbi:MAG TPA: HNH endonuclease [Candidatus Nanopelagicaceae bacterium]|nr:HNH endonuclease [Candidatus Nanopelagicaceae bacterium]